MTSALEQEYTGLAEQTQNWTCEYMFNVAESKDDEPIVVDLSKCFWEKKVYTFPKHFKGLEHKQ